MLNFLISLLLVTPGQYDVAAMKLDGSQIAGKLVGWSDGKLTLQVADKPVTLAEQELLSFQVESTYPSPEPAKMSIELVDGTTLPVSRLIIDGDDATAAWDDRLLADQPDLRISVKKISAVRLRPFSATAEKQWSEIRVLALPSDVLVVTSKDDDHLDYVEGLIRKVTESSVEFTVDGDAISVNRSKVAGLIYYREQSDLRKVDSIILRGSFGFLAHALRVALVGETLHGSTVAGVDFQWPLDELVTADFSGGKIVYLCEMEPVTSHWEPWVGSPSSAALATLYGRPQSDRSLLGGPLTLRSRENESIAQSTTTYSHGLSVHSRTELVYRLPKGFRRFSAIVGIDPAADRLAHVVLTIRGNDRLLFESEISASDNPLAIDVDIKDVQRLDISVDFGQNLDRGDVLNICDAKIVK